MSGISRLGNGTGPAGPFSSITVNGPSVFNGSLTFKRTTTAIDYNVQTSDFYIGVTDTSAPRTITLPAAAPEGMSFCIKDESGGAFTNNITVDVSGGGLIDGDATTTINANYDALWFISDGTNYFTW